MTVRELMEQTYRAVGEPSDLEIYDYDQVGTASFNIANAGSIEMLRLLNRAYKRLAMFKQPDGSHVKFRSFFKRLFFKPTALSFTVSVAGTVNRLITLATANTYARDYFSGWYLLAGGNEYLIIGSEPSTGAAVQVTVDRVPSTDHTGSTAEVYSRHYSIVENIAGYAYGSGDQQVVALPDAKLVSIQRVFNVDNSDQEVMPAMRDDIFLSRPQGRQNPTLWKQQGNVLEFNYSPVNGTVFRIDYYSEPELLSTETQEPVILDAWQEIIWMIAVAIRLREDKNIEEAIAKEREIQQVMQMLVQETEHEYDLSQGYVTAQRYFRG